MCSIKEISCLLVEKCELEFDPMQKSKNINKRPGELIRGYAVTLSVSGQTNIVLGGRGSACKTLWLKCRGAIVFHNVL